MRCYRRLLNITYRDHVTNEEVHNKIQDAIGKHGEEAETRMVRSYLKSILNGKDNVSRDSKRIRRGRQRKRWEDNTKDWNFANL